MEKRYYYVISEDGELRLTTLDTMSPEEAAGYNISKPDGTLVKSIDRGFVVESREV